jgi:hypothetical protein
MLTIQREPAEPVGGMTDPPNFQSLSRLLPKGTGNLACWGAPVLDMGSQDYANHFNCNHKLHGDHSRIVEFFRPQSILQQKAN